MTKIDRSTKTPKSSAKLPGTPFLAWSGMAAQGAGLQQASQSIAAEFEAYSAAWMKRRQEAAETAAEAGKRIARGAMSDPTAAMMTIAEWQAGSFQRIAADMQGCTDMMARCAQAVAKASTATADEAEAEEPEGGSMPV